MSSILELERCISDLPQIGITTRHYFCAGMYAREIFIPESVLLTGKVHKTEHFNVLSKGLISISMIDRSEIIEAPYTFVSGVGSKKAIFAHEDSVFTTFHITGETDLDKIEEEMTSDEAISIDRTDHENFLLEYGLSEELSRNVSENTTDLVTVEGLPVYVYPSDREGRGVFASDSFGFGETIGPARVGGLRTQIGRYANHSAFPNSTMALKDDGDIDLICIKQIEKGDEIVIDYRSVMTLQNVEPG